MKALIIAAGKGNRLRKFESDKPKPLFKVAGLSLIERGILSAKKAGITEFVVVTGYRGDEIERKLARHRKRLGVSIEFVRNGDWEKANGHSVLKAREHLNDDFVLLMADHIFDWRLLEGFLKAKPRKGEVVLAVDDRIDKIFDIDDATKVKTDDGSIVTIGKSLSDFDAVDTGIFYCSTGIFPALERACAEGKGSLSEAISLLADAGKAKTFPIGNQFWQDVDTPHSLKHAHKVLFRSVRKETDGIISRYFNRKVSGLITRFLIRTPFTANQITWSALVIGLLSGFLISRGEHLYVALGGIIFQFASIYDGCDGEISKLKLSSSKFGEWLDTICDNITYVAFIVGVVVGAYRQGFEHIVPIGFLTVFGVGMTLGTMYLYLAKFTNSGSLVTVQKDLARDMEIQEQGFFIRMLGKIKFMMKRDFFALFFMTLCLLNRLDWILILAVIGSNLTWIVLLTMKRELAPAKAELPENSQI
jgi:CDP-L-myo-inositol myo-inositolphosphotransferase